jgi:hypothetical protein
VTVGPKRDQVKPNGKKWVNLRAVYQPAETYFVWQTITETLARRPVRARVTVRRPTCPRTGTAVTCCAADHSPSPVTSQKPGRAFRLAAGPAGTVIPSDIL